MIKKGYVSRKSWESSKDEELIPTIYNYASQPIRSLEVCVIETEKLEEVIKYLKFVYQSSIGIDKQYLNEVLKTLEGKS